MAEVVRLREEVRHDPNPFPNPSPSPSLSPNPNPNPNPNPHQVSHGLMGSHAKDKPPERLPAAQRFAGVRLTIVEARGLTSKVS